MSIMRNLDLLAERALAEPVAAPSSMGSLRERARRHNQNRANARRVAVGLAVVVPLVVIGALVVDRPSTVRIEAVSGGTAEVGEVYGARLAGNGLVWPAEPVPLDQLLNEVAAEFLGWPAVEWDRSDLVGSERAVTATQPGRPDRRVAMQVRERVPGAGWQILSLYPPPRVLLTGGQLTGFDVDVPADAERVDVFHLDPVDGTQSWTTLIDDVAGASAIQLAAPVPAERAGTYLIVARDAAGEATLVTGLSLGSLDRLTFAIDALTGAGVPEPLPAEVAAIVT